MCVNALFLVFNNFQSLQKSLEMATNYQEVIQWLLNIGLLPEGFTKLQHINEVEVEEYHGSLLVYYPYDEMKNYYNQKRSKFRKIRESFIDKKTGSCRLLYIDAFLDQICGENDLKSQWENCGGTGLYPPRSIEAMLRVFLLPTLTYDQQCSLLWYFFLDLQLFLSEEENLYRDVIGNFMKFPSVFKVPAPLTKMVLSLWNLDHDYFMVNDLMVKIFVFLVNYYCFLVF